jgi:hypothetical protein
MPKKGLFMQLFRQEKLHLTTLGKDTATGEML